jgi:CHAD domain-containing protein
MEGYRIYKQEAFPDTYRRVTAELIRDAMIMCRKSDMEPDLTVHEIRKITKRVRSVFRLFRQATGDATYQRGIDKFRTISGLLAELRVSRVHADTLREMSIEKKYPLDSTVTARLLRRFHRQHKRLLATAFERKQLFRQVGSLLSAELDHAESQPLSECEFGMLADNIRRSYKNGRSDLDIMLNQYTPENLHNLRKTVKGLWNQLILIRPVWPSGIGTMIHNLDALAEKLGKEHDLDELDLILSRKRKNQNLLIPAELGDYINFKRLQLLRSIMPMAMRVFSEKPGSLSGRLNTYYHVWKGM